MAWLQLIALNVAVFILQLLLPQITGTFGFIPANAYAAPWTFVTSIFLHSNMAHLFFNMWALFAFGPLLEQRIGESRFYAIYFLSGIVGNLAFALFYPANILGLGASGAIYGIMGAMAVLMPNLIILVFFLPMPMWLAAIFWAALEFLLAGSSDAIAHFVHLAGLFVGVAWALSIKRELPRHPIYD